MGFSYLSYTQLIKLLSGPLSFILCSIIFPLDPANAEVSKMAGVTLWIGIWWFTEAIPLGITALLPLVLFPLTGITGTREIAPVYMNHIIFLFIGGFLLAFSMERWNLHKRFSLMIINLFGLSPAKMLLGFMVASYFLSMWISNSATTIMLIAPALALISKTEDWSEGITSRLFSTGLLLGIAYAASIGGTATPIGTPPNLIFLNHYQGEFPNAGEISFFKWFTFGLPFSLVFFAIAYWWINKKFCSGLSSFGNAQKEILQKEKAELGAFRYEEKVVSTAMVITALLWLFRADIQIGNFSIPGWAGFLPYEKFIEDSTVAIFMALVLFLVPARNARGTILNWETVKRIPFDVIFLFGGGFALAKGFETSGLSTYLSQKLTFLSGMNSYLLVLIICFTITFLTEIASNTATTQLFLPILIILVKVLDISPFVLLIPATFSASFAFMLPVATPPNTIVYGSEKIDLRAMIRTGLLLNITGLLLLLAASHTFAKWIFE